MKYRDEFVGFIAAGNTFEVPVDLVVNRQSQSVTGVRVVAKVPQGITLVDVVGQGVFKSPDMWEVGTVMPMNSVHGRFVFRYDDPTTNEFEIGFELFATGCQACFSDTELTVNAHIATCEDCKYDYEVVELSTVPKTGVATGHVWKYPGANALNSPVYEMWIHLSEADWQTLTGMGANHPNNNTGAVVNPQPVPIPGFDKTTDKITIIDYEIESMHIDPVNGWTNIRRYNYYGFHIFYDYDPANANDELMIEMTGGIPLPDQSDEGILHITFIREPNIHA